MRSVFLLVAIMVFVIVAQAPSEVFAKKPPPPPPEPVIAEDVVCDGCVGTIDIEDGVVTTQKLSTDVQNEINQLRTDINQLQAFPHGVTKLFDGKDTFIGNYIAAPGLSAYHPDAKVFFGIEFLHVINGVDTDGWMLIGFDVRFESFDCTGQGFVDGLQAPGTENVLFAINHSNLMFFKTINHNVFEKRTYSPQSKLNKSTGNCELEYPGEYKYFWISPVIEVPNPLPYSFPLFSPLKYTYSE